MTWEKENETTNGVERKFPLAIMKVFAQSPQTLRDTQVNKHTPTHTRAPVSPLPGRHLSHLWARDMIYFAAKLLKHLSAPATHSSRRGVSLPEARGEGGMDQGGGVDVTGFPRDNNVIKKIYKTIYFYFLDSDRILEVDKRVKLENIRSYRVVYTESENAVIIYENHKWKTEGRHGGGKTACVWSCTWRRWALSCSRGLLPSPAFKSATRLVPEKVTLQRG